MKVSVLIIASATVLLLGCDQERGDKRVAQQITCVNNLKQIGIEFRIWSGDHQGQYPFNLSTNAGGTMEFCEVGKDGFDSNAFLHFKAMGGDESLKVPWLLVCPQDKSRKAATNWASLRAENVTYRLRTGTNIHEGDPHEVLVVCPVDGNTLHGDGTVTTRK